MAEVDLSPTTFTSRSTSDSDYDISTEDSSENENDNTNARTNNLNCIRNRASESIPHIVDKTDWLGSLTSQFQKECTKLLHTLLLNKP